jgi:hypothetical protein
MRADFRTMRLRSSTGDYLFTSVRPIRQNSSFGRSAMSFAISLNARRAAMRLDDAGGGICPWYLGAAP